MDNPASAFQEKVSKLIGQQAIVILRQEAQIEGLQAENARLFAELEKARADASRPA